LNQHESESLNKSESKNPSRNTPEIFKAEIVCRDLDVKYEDSSKPALRNIDLEIPAGSFVAIVGPSGSGKTTLADALLGIAIPVEGYVTISGVSPNRAISLWPNKIKYVPQDVQLVSGSVRENICWPESSLQFSDESILEVLDLVELKDWLISQPNRLDAKIGLGGSNLSGGQKQRLGIARALIAKPQVLILDESTSALDTETESLIADRILKNMQGITRVVIAHRLSTVIHADKLVYLESGRKLAEGNFSELRSLVPQFDKNATANGA
jgi:ATP-binding cassette subfamily C protein